MNRTIFFKTAVNPFLREQSASGLHATERMYAKNTRDKLLGDFNVIQR
jgi:hypothetical protein